jgi:hypothetical protein
MLNKKQINIKELKLNQKLIDSLLRIECISATLQKCRVIVYGGIVRAILKFMVGVYEALEGKDIDLILVKNCNENEFQKEYKTFHNGITRILDIHLDLKISTMSELDNVIHRAKITQQQAALVFSKGTSYILYTTDAKEDCKKNIVRFRDIQSFYGKLFVHDFYKVIEHSIKYSPNQVIFSESFKKYINSNNAIMDIAVNFALLKKKNFNLKKAFLFMKAHKLTCLSSDDFFKKINPLMPSLELTLIEPLPSINSSLFAPYLTTYSKQTYTSTQ